MRYVFSFVDRCTRYTWVYGLPSLSHEHITKALIKTKLDFGRLPARLYTDFDHKLISGKVESYANKHDCTIFGSPAGRQHQNGLVEPSWQTLANMARSCITQYKMPREYWWWAIRHAAQVINLFPCSVDGIKTSPLSWYLGYVRITVS